MDTLELPVVEPLRVTWYQADGDRRRWAPLDRPPVGGRLFVGLLAFGAMLTAGALLLSDRAPGLLRAMFGERARRLWERIDATDRVGVPAGSELTSTDFVVHIAIWAVVTVLVGMAVWTWRGLAFAAVATGGISLALELAQGRYATSRTVQATDAMANLIGVSLGALAAGCCYIVWSAGAGVLRRLRPGRRADVSGSDRRSLR